MFTRIPARVDLLASLVVIVYVVGAIVILARQGVFALDDGTNELKLAAASVNQIAIPNGAAFPPPAQLAAQLGQLETQLKPIAGSKQTALRETDPKVIVISNKSTPEKVRLWANSKGGPLLQLDEKVGAGVRSPIEVAPQKPIRALPLLLLAVCCLIGSGILAALMLAHRYWSERRSYRTWQRGRIDDWRRVVDETIGPDAPLEGFVVLVPHHKLEHYVDRPPAYMFAAIKQRWNVDCWRTGETVGEPELWPQSTPPQQLARAWAEFTAKIAEINQERWRRQQQEQRLEALIVS